MARQKLVEELNKEVRNLRKDVSEIKSVLLNVLAIPEESIKSYKNSRKIRTAFKKTF